jgi:hypothetical protein
MKQWVVILSYGNTVTVYAESADDAVLVYARDWGDYKSIDRVEPVSES